MDGATLIKVLLVKRGLNSKDLSDRLHCTPSNIYNKFKRNNLSLNEVEEMADILDCDVEIRFIDRKTQKEI